MIVDSSDGLMMKKKAVDSNNVTTNSDDEMMDDSNDGVMNCERNTLELDGNSLAGNGREKTGI